MNVVARVAIDYSRRQSTPTDSGKLASRPGEPSDVKFGRQYPTGACLLVLAVQRQQVVLSPNVRDVVGDPPLPILTLELSSLFWQYQYWNKLIANS